MVDEILWHMKDWCRMIAQRSTDYLRMLSMQTDHIVNVEVACGLNLRHTSYLRMSCCREANIICIMYRIKLQCSCIITQLIVCEILTTDTTQLTHEGEIWGVIYKFKVWSIFYLTYCNAAHNVLYRCVQSRIWLMEWLISWLHNATPSIHCDMFVREQLCVKDGLLYHHNHLL